MIKICSNAIKTPPVIAKAVIKSFMPKRAIAAGSIRVVSFAGSFFIFRSFVSVSSSTNDIGM